MFRCILLEPSPADRFDATTHSMTDFAVLLRGADVHAGVSQNGLPPFGRCRKLSTGRSLILRNTHMPRRGLRINGFQLVPKGNHSCIQKPIYIQPIMCHTYAVYQCPSCFTTSQAFRPRPRTRRRSHRFCASTLEMFSFFSYGLV